jgi:hypothetical protein
MFRLKTILVLMIVPVFVLAGIIMWQARVKEDHGRKMVLAQDVRKVMNYLMFDLRETRGASLKGVPPDGAWHERVAFEHSTGPVEYSLKEGHVSRLGAGKTVAIADHISNLRMRRQAANPGIIEVQITARDKASLVSNFKIRMQD